MSMRPQDVVVAVKLALAPPEVQLTYPELASALEISLSEAHAAVKRATASGLVSSSRKANRTALFDFLVSSCRSAFVPKRGALTRGMPTAHGAPPLDQLVGLGAEPPPVWPDPDGSVRGESFQPLYRSVPKAAKKDPKLYEALCLIDALRGGRQRDWALAEEYLRKLILPAGASEKASARRFAREEPRRRRIELALEQCVGRGTAAFYRSAVQLLAMDKPIEATSHLVAHLATDIESSLGDVILEVMDVLPPERKGQELREKEKEGHRTKIEGILRWLEIPIDGAVGRDWLSVAGVGNEKGFAARRHRKGLGPRPIDQDFVDLWDRFEGVLEVVLDAFERKYAGVYARLDQMLAKLKPTEADARILRGQIPQTPQALGYFFDKLKDPAWIEPLEKTGFFARPPEPIRDATGVEFPAWPVLGYLARMVSERPEDVARIALAIPPTDHIGIRARLAAIAQALPSKLAEPFADQVDGWLEGEYSRNMSFPLTGNISGLIAKLAADGYRDAALRALAALLRPVRREADNRELRNQRPEARMPTWKLGQTSSRLLPTILDLGEAALGVMCELLEEALALSRESDVGPWQDGSSYWRPEIEENGANRQDDLLAYFVSAVRDLAVRLVEGAPARLAEIVTSLEARRWVIFCRLGLYLLGKFPNVAPDAVVARIVERSCFDLPGPEYARLLRRSFGLLDAQQKETVLSWIEQGRSWPGVEDDLWKMEWLATIADSLPPQWRGKFDLLKAKHGDVPAADAAPRSHGPFVGPTSPFKVEAFAKMPPAQVVDMVSGWRPSSAFGAPDPGGLSRVLAAVVEQSPDDWLAAVEDLKRLDPTYLRGVLEGLKRVLRTGGPLAWYPLVDLCAWIASQPREIPGGVDTLFGFDAHWGHARQWVLMLLDDAFSLRGSAIPADLRALLWSAIEPMLDDPNGVEENHEAEIRDLALNRVRGIAVHVAVDYAHWVAKQTASRGLPEEVRKALDVKVREPFAAVRAALAERINTLVDLDRAWCEAMVRELFKRDECGRDIAWEAYLEYDRLSPDGFRLLHWRYRIAIDEMASGSNLSHRDEELAESIGTHLARLYWHGHLTKGGRDSLLDKFLANAPATITGKLMQEIGRWLHVDGEPPPEVRKRLKELWTKRAAVGRTEELAVFSWWFSSGHLEEEWALDNFLQALRALGHHAVGSTPIYAPNLGERMAELAPRHASKIMSCLELMVMSNEHGWGMPDLRQAVRSILSAALASPSHETKKKAADTIGRLARMGRPEFRDLPIELGSVGTT